VALREEGLRVSFWRRNNESVDPEESPTESEPAAESSPVIGSLAPIRIYTHGDGVIDGWMEVGSQRLSDLLNAEDTLSVSRVRDDPTNADWQAIDREDMMIVVAPPHASSRQLRVHRHRLEMRANCALYSITGTVHLIPGNRLDRQMLRTRQHFLPITDASGSTAASPEEPFEDETLLLNIVNVSEDLSLSVIE
jgi:hypothetical protein